MFALPTDLKLWLFGSFRGLASGSVLKESFEVAGSVDDRNDLEACGIFTVYNHVRVNGPESMPGTQRDRPDDDPCRVFVRGGGLCHATAR